MSPAKSTLERTRVSFRQQWEQLKPHQRAKIDYLRQDDEQLRSAMTLSSFADYLQRTLNSSAQKDLPPPVNPLQLAEIATDFHKRAGTHTNAVEDSIQDYTSATPSLRVAHQPNFLASLNVVGQAAMCAELAGKLKPPSSKVGDGTLPVQIFFVVDYDASGDRRYRHAKIPSLSSRLGYHSLSVPYSHGHEDEFMFVEQNPPLDLIENFSRRLTSYSSHDFSVLRKSGDISFRRDEFQHRQSKLGSDLRAAFIDGKSVADANSILLSRYINNTMGLPTIFVPGSAALSVVIDHLKYLWSRSHDYYSACQAVASEFEDAGLPVSRGLVQPSSTAPFWMQCQKDQSRVIMHFTDRGFGKVKGTCGRCNNDTELSLKSAADALVSKQQPAIIPRVIWDDLLDGFAWGHMGGCSYGGGLEHYLFTAAVANRMGLPTLPEFISHSDAPPGPTWAFKETAALMGQSSTDGHTDSPALRLLTQGTASLAHWALWNPNMKSDDVARTFSSDR